MPTGPKGQERPADAIGLSSTNQEKAFRMKKLLGLLGFVLIFAMQANSASAISKASQAAQIYHNRQAALAAESYHHRGNPMSWKYNTFLYEPPYRSCKGTPGCR